MTNTHHRPTSSTPGHWIGAEVSSSGIRSGVFNATGSVLGKAKVSAKLERGPDAVIARVARCIRYAVDECDLRMESIAGIGVAVSGSVDGSGRMVNSTELGWENVPLASALQAELKLPVQIGQCFELGARGILAQEFTPPLPRCVAVVFPGPRIGAAVSVAGEFVRLESAAASEADRSLASSGWIGEVPHALFGTFRGRDFRKALKKHPTGPVQVYALELARCSGVAAAQLWRTWDLEMIVLAGGLMDEMTEELIVAARAGFREASGSAPTAEPAWRVSTLGDLASIAGAAILARDAAVCAV